MVALTNQVSSSGDADLNTGMAMGLRLQMGSMKGGGHHHKKKKRSKKRKSKRKRRTRHYQCNPCKFTKKRTNKSKKRNNKSKKRKRKTLQSMRKSLKI
tara:strand:+ start:2296 stop:2589 length:294 start_codon:yes stop_codon:yes gene_type:complete